MSAQEQSGSTLTREQILAALQVLSDELGKQSLDLVGQYYPSNRIPVKPKYLVEGLFEAGKI